MLVLAPLTFLVAAVAALQNPHRKAASFKHPANGLRKREVPSSPIDHKFLNEKTESKCRTLPLLGSETIYLQSTPVRIPSERNSFPTGSF